MIATKIIWPSAPDLVRRTLSAHAADIITDFESELIVFIDIDADQLVSYRTWPTNESAQLWIDYIGTNFEIIEATIINEPIKVPENVTILGQVQLDSL